MAGERTFVVKFISDTLAATKGIKKVGDDLGTLGKQVDTNLGSKFKSIMPSFKTVAVAGTAAFAAVSAALYKSVEAAIESEAEQNRLRKILQTTTGASDEQIDSLNKQAQALQNLGVVSAGTTSVVQAQLATFDLSVDTIKTLTPAILDYVTAEKGASATAEDFKSSTNGLAQALQGNFASLTKTGFVLDDATKKTIKSGTESERAAALVAVLGSTYEGFNESLRDTPEGQLQALQNDFKDLSTAVGIALLPALGSAVGFLNDSVVPAFRNFGTALEEGGVSGGFDFIANRFKEAAPKVLEALGQLITQAVEWIGTSGLPMLFAGISQLADSLTGWIEPRIPMFINELTKFLMAGYQWIYTKGLPQLLSAVQSLGDTLASFVGKAARQLPAQLVDMIATIGKWILSDGIPAVLAMGARLGGSLIKWTLTIGGQLILGLGGAVVALVAAIPDMFAGFVKGIANIAVNAVKGFVGKFDEMKTALANIAVSAVNTLIDVFNKIPLIPNIPKITLDTKKLGTQVGLTGAELQRVNERFDQVNGTLKVGSDEMKDFDKATKDTNVSTGGAAKTLKTAKEKLELYTGALDKSTKAKDRFNKSQKAEGKALTSLTDANTDLANAQARLAQIERGFGVGSPEALAAQAELAKAQRSQERAVYAVEEAVFSVADAEKNLAEVRKDPASSPMDIRRAEISLAESKLSVSDATDSQIESTKELNDQQRLLNDAIFGATVGSILYDRALEDVEDATRAQVSAYEAWEDAVTNTKNAQDEFNKSLEATAELIRKYPKVLGGMPNPMANLVPDSTLANNAGSLFNGGGMGNVNIEVNAGLGASGIEIGQEIDQYLREYLGFSGQTFSLGSIGNFVGVR
jgi:hypothetical protein